ncbi:MAG: DUF4286 family protein [Bradymonadaceae bacterium]
MLYIVSIQIDADVADDWEAWMADEHIPDVLATECFASATMARDEEAETRERKAYRIVYRATSREAYREYVEEHADELKAEHTGRYRGQFEASRELLPVVAAW